MRFFIFFIGISSLIASVYFIWERDFSQEMSIEHSLTLDISPRPAENIEKMESPKKEEKRFHSPPEKPVFEPETRTLSVETARRINQGIQPSRVSTTGKIVAPADLDGAGLKLDANVSDGVVVFTKFPSDSRRKGD